MACHINKAETKPNRTEPNRTSLNWNVCRRKCCAKLHTHIWHRSGHCIWQQWGIWHRLRLNCNLPDNIQRHFGCNCKMFLSSLPNIIKNCRSIKKKIERNIICCDKKREGIKRYREKQMITFLMTKKYPDRSSNMATVGIKVNTTPLININELILW